MQPLHEPNATNRRTLAVCAALASAWLAGCGGAGHAGARARSSTDVRREFVLLHAGARAPFARIVLEQPAAGGDVALGVVGESAAPSCFAFELELWIDGRPTVISAAVDRLATGAEVGLGSFSMGTAALAWTRARVVELEHAHRCIEERREPQTSRGLAAR